MTNHNACIQILSSRQKCIELCLESIHKHYNHKHNYPIYVHYFDDIYDNYKTDIPNVSFIRVPYSTPQHIKEEELFYNRDNAYAKGFGKRRKGYLHMCNFIVNFHEHTKIRDHKYVFVFDDDSGLTKELKIDPIDVMSKRREDMGACKTSRRLGVDGKPTQRYLDTRECLWDFTSGFLKENNIIPKCSLMCRVTKDSYHRLPWSDGYVIKTKMYKSSLWRKWLEAVNASGGIYKHRWGDNEIMSLFYMIHNDSPIYNLRLVEDGYLDQGLFRMTQNMASAVKDNEC